jgi:hypothetical protein
MLDATIAIRMDRGLFAITHSQHKAANVKERPFAKNAGWPLSYVHGSVLVAALLAQDQRTTGDLKQV